MNFEPTSMGELEAGRSAARAALGSPELAGAQDEQRRDRTRLQLLSDAGRALAGSLDSTDTACRIAHLTVPWLADWATFHRWDGERLRFGCLAHSESALEAQLSPRLAALHFSPDDRGVLARVVRTRRSVLLVGAHRPAEVFGTHELDDATEALGVHSCVCAPVVAGDRLLGTLTCCLARPNENLDVSDLALLEELAARTGLALDNARLYQEAQHALRSRDHVMAIVSHDLRNPLNTIALNLDVLSRLWRGDAQARGRGQLETVQRTVRRVGRMVEDLLAASTIQSGHFTVRASPERPEVLREELVAALEPMAAHQAVQLEASFPEGLPDVRCDRDRVLQVFGNLCGNALHVLPEGGRIRVSARPAGGFVCFTVADSGPGIPPAQLASVFDRYWQAEPGTSSGVGLGLFIVKGIVEAHGGRVWAESPAGDGAHFNFTLPLAD